MGILRGIFVLALIAFLSLPALAEGYWTIMLDDQPVPAELPPVVVSDKVLLVSARSLCHRLGAQYAYDPTSGVITISSAAKKVEMKEGSLAASVNGKPASLPAQPRRENGTLMVPVPFVPQALGCTVSLNQATRMVMITTPPGSAPVASPLVVSDPPVMASAPPPAAQVQPAQQPAAAPPASPDQAKQNPMYSPVPGKSALTSGMVPGMSTVIPFELMGASGTAPSSMPGLNSGQPWRVQAGATPGSQDYPQVNSLALPEDRQVARAGAMDALSLTSSASASADGMARPDPAVTGVTIERRMESLFTTYYVRYRVTNLGPVAAERQMLCRLLIGGQPQDGMQLVQDLKVDRLAPGQSMEFEWTGNSRTFPILHSVTIRAEARLMLVEGAYDADANNNSRKARLSY